MFDNHVTVLIGENGSGKTVVALQAAREQQRAGLRSTLVSFRVAHPFDPVGHGSMDAAAVPANACPEAIDCRTAADPVALISLLRELVRDRKRRIIVDAASDKATRLVLSQCLEALPARLIDRVLVVNFMRPFTRTVGEALEASRELQGSMGMPVTAIVGNTHMMRDTTAEMVLQGHHAAQSLAGQLGVPLVAIAVESSNAAAVPRSGISCPLLMLGAIGAAQPSTAEARPAGKSQSASARAGGAPCHRS